METNLRIHISPVGFEFKRVTEPLIRMQADKVYLVSYQENDSGQRYLQLIKKELSENYKHIKIAEVFVDIWDLYQCIEKFREIIHKEGNNHVYINVSTGTKITAIAGMFSCMLWNANPYYAKVNYLARKKEIDILPENIGELQPLPVYGINKPKFEFMLVLDLLKSAGGKMKKAHLISKLEEKEIIRLKDETKVVLTKPAKHSQLRAILDPMEFDWKYIRVEASGRRSEVFLTEQGDNALKIFGVHKNKVNINKRV
jgi:CRISPR locus-related DNA-binding protein